MDEDLSLLGVYFTLNNMSINRISVLIRCIQIGLSVELKRGKLVQKPDYKGAVPPESEEERLWLLDSLNNMTENQKALCYYAVSEPHIMRDTINTLGMDL